MYTVSGAQSMDNRALVCSYVILNRFYYRSSSEPFSKYSIQIVEVKWSFLEQKDAKERG